MNKPDCSHPDIVPINADWAMCTTCGDDTFPISAFAAGYDEEKPSPAEVLLIERDHRIARQRIWIVALVVGLLGSVVHHAIDNIRHIRHHAAASACTERAP